MKKIVFIIGIHRSGTSILHRIVQASEQVTGFEKTGVFRNKEHSLPSVLDLAGSPGKLALDQGAYPDETSGLITRI